MKKYLIMITISALSFSTFGENLYNLNKKYQEAIQLIHVEGKKNEGKLMLKRLMAQASPHSDLRKKIKKSYSHLVQGKNKESIKFAFGKKREFYCRGIGLVLLEGKHANGSKSRMVLKDGERRLSNKYSRVTDGRWIYELSNSFRKPIDSEVWVDNSSNKMIGFKEVRKRLDGGIDNGEYRCELDGTGRSSTCSFSTRGEVEEPLPMFLATDYHMWGNRFYGYNLKFKVGYSDHSGSVESTIDNRKRLFLKSNRLVKKYLPELMVKDSLGVERHYNGCFQVDYDIYLDRVSII